MAAYLPPHPSNRDAGGIYGSNASHGVNQSADYGMKQEHVGGQRSHAYVGYPADQSFKTEGATLESTTTSRPNGIRRSGGLEVQVDTDKTPVLSDNPNPEGSISPTELPESVGTGMKLGAQLNHKSTLLSPFVPGSGGTYPGTTTDDQYCQPESPSKGDWQNAASLSTPVQPIPEGDARRTMEESKSAMSTPYGGGVTGYSYASYTPSQVRHPGGSYPEGGPGSAQSQVGQDLPPAMTYQPFQFRPPPANIHIETFQAPVPQGTPGQYTYPVAYQTHPDGQVYQHPADPNAMAPRAYHPGQPLDQAWQYPQPQMAYNTMQGPPGAQYHYVIQPGPQAGPPGMTSVDMQPSGTHVQPGQAGPPGVVFARSTDTKMARPKVKLTYDDKRRIVEISHSNTNLRQEDIAQQYGVDRSTISKILIQAHRWTGPPQPPVVPIPKPAKQSGGRFPAIEHEMLKWWDGQEACGREVKDSTAREHAKEIARMMGFGEDRFKASAKWLDKFKERRKRPYALQQGSSHEGSPMSYSGSATPSSAMTPGFPTFPQHGMFLQPGNGYSHASGYNSPLNGQLSRSQSSTTLASMDSSHVGYPVNGNIYGDRSHPVGWQDPDSAGLHGSISDISNVSSALHSRQRSRSSPQRNGPFDFSQAGAMDPASGRAPKTMTSGLQRSQSTRVAGVSPSPRRPGTLHRTQSSTSSVSSRRGNRPTSLAASAFGLTPMQQPDDALSGTETPASGTPSHTPDRRQSIESVHAPMRPFTTSMSSMNISPAETMSSAGTLTSSSSSNSIQQHSLSGPMPITPIAPGGHFVEYRHVEPGYAPSYQGYQPVQMVDPHRQPAYTYASNVGYQQHAPGPVYDNKVSAVWRADG